ncbi:MAG: molybdate ABC transporter substrate-binding protein [bacterium]|nr:molybdate ABC transporter substrate-binding protein [bacterium]
MLVSAASGAEPLLIAAASDLSAVEKPLAAAFRQATGMEVRFVLHSSGMLARQIQNGAPYDVYLSANEKYVRDLVDSGDLVGDTVEVYAIGRLGLWSKRGGIERIEQLRAPGVRNIAIANPVHAPYGVAAKEALLSQKLWDSLAGRIVFAENVRQTFQYGDSGNADAIVTSWTLVHDKGGVMLPAEWHNPIRQAGGVTTHSKQRAAAERFVDFLVSQEGQAVLEGRGLSRTRPREP